MIEIDYIGSRVFFLIKLYILSKIIQTECQYLTLLLHYFQIPDCPSCRGEIELEGKKAIEGKFSKAI
jgi:hypothetical protein